MSLSALQEFNTIPQSAIGRRVRIAYTNGCEEPSIRVIEPLRIYRGRNGYTYLRAYCHLREEERTFRLDRIRSWQQIGWGPIEAAGADEGADKPAHTAPYSKLKPFPRPTRYTPHTVASARTAPPANPQGPMALPVEAKGGICAMNTAFAPAASTSARQSVRSRHPFRTLLLLALLFLTGRWLVTSGTAEDILWAVEDALSGGAAPPGRHERYADSSALGKTPAASRTVPATPNDKAATTPEALPKPVKRFSYRGVDIIATPRGDTYLYTAPAYSLSAANRRALHLQINAQLFRQAAGIADPGLEVLYAGADTDRDDYLCWKEIKEFQRKLTLRYKYRHNATALRPDEFLAQGGGDCEDWALVTCGLLRYWDWDGYVAAFFPPGGGDGHALCMVRWTDMPRGFEYYTVEEGVYAWDGEPVRPGYYVPIDYEVVGGSSSAVKRGWRLRHFYSPERIYGRTM